MFTNLITVWWLKWNQYCPVMSESCQTYLNPLSCFWVLCSPREEGPHGNSQLGSLEEHSLSGRQHPFLSPFQGLLPPHDVWSWGQATTFKRQQ